MRAGGQWRSRKMRNAKCEHADCHGLSGCVPNEGRRDNRLRSESIVVRRRFRTEPSSSIECDMSRAGSMRVLPEYQVIASRVEPNAYSRKRIRSAVELRLYPSAIAAGTPLTALQSWSAIRRPIGARYTTDASSQVRYVANRANRYASTRQSGSRRSSARTAASHILNSWLGRSTPSTLRLRTEPENVSAARRIVWPRISYLASLSSPLT